MQLIFFAFSFLIVFSGHLLLWFVLVKLLGIASFYYQIILGALLFFLLSSAVIASILIHQWDNLFTRWYYILASFWIGSLVNFGLMLLVILLLKFIGPIFGFIVPLNYLRLIFFGGTIILSLWGVYNAWQPRLTEYTVYIKDLPTAWQDKTIVHVSDIHLGPVYRQHFFARLIGKIEALRPEAVFITGDLFDGMEADFNWLTEPFTKLVAPRGVFYSFGNHDLYLGFDRAKGFLQDSIKVLDNKLVVVDGLQIIGINYSFNKDFDLEKEILTQVGYDQLQPSILLFHEPKNIGLAKNAGIDLQLSGHTHRGQLFPINLLAGAMYQGFGYGLFQEGDLSLIVTSGVGTWGPPLRTSGRGEIVKIILKKK